MTRPLAKNTAITAMAPRSSTVLYRRSFNLKAKFESDSSYLSFKI